MASGGLALCSAILFGMTTPLAKQLVVQSNPLLIAGLLYGGSGIGLTAMILIQDRGKLSLGLPRGEIRWLALAIAFGGVVAPALLMFGLARADAAAASLLLNLEPVMTAVIAWLVFREATSSRIVAGFAAILAGSLILALPPSWWVELVGGAHSAGSAGAGAVGAGAGVVPAVSVGAEAGTTAGPDWRPLLLIAGACLCWGVDNNLTRKISAGDARMIAAIKGLAAGTTNIGLAMYFQPMLPAVQTLASAMVLGFLGYGLSLVLFIVSLRSLGTARTGAYFATAPFIGAAAAILLYGQQVTWAFWIAALCMAVGVWLHLTEQHEHEHDHELLIHTHAHSHDDHHKHVHEADWDGVEPHSHEHRHEPIRHRHPHFPDIHHQHGHG